jgi:D-tyrosyl-tRNA(Tyr) deacylase
LLIWRLPRLIGKGKSDLTPGGVTGAENSFDKTGHYQETDPCNRREVRVIMRAVLQRVRHARVVVDGVTIGEIQQGLLVLLGVERSDTADQARWLAEKVVGLRIFNDADGKMNLDVGEVGGSVLVVSQFTLYGDCRKGRRPSFVDAAPPESAVPLYEEFVEAVKAQGIPTATGRFGAMMQVELVNDGPVTLIVERK